MTERWLRESDVAWTGDDRRVIAARTSPPDPDGPRVLEGAAAWVWMALAEPTTAEELATLALTEGAPASARDDVVTALTDLRRAGLAHSL